MLAPYTKETREVFDKIHIFRSYTPNAIYKSPNNRLYYINSRGYMHIYDFKIEKFNGSPLYVIYDLLLTTDNKLTESSRKYSSNKATMKEDVRRLIEEAERNTAEAA